MWRDKAHEFIAAMALWSYQQSNINKKKQGRDINTIDLTVYQR